MKQAMIFAAGLGTRLRPFTETKPKALVEVAGKPLLHHVIDRLKSLGYHKIVVNVHHFAEQIEDYIRRNDNFGIDITISSETNFLLETGGGIRHAQSLFDKSSPILIHNVDILSNADVLSLYVNASADAALLVSNRKTNRYLLFDDEMKLVGWTNIATGEIRSPYQITDIEHFQRFAFSGIHLFSNSLFPLMEIYPDRFKIIDFYIEQCQRMNIIGVVQPSLRLLDVGKIDSLQQAEEFIKSI